ncbi:hypothetical protein Tco_1399089, partial [Tanacetum coccineum]
EILEKVLQESLTDAYPTQRGPLPPVVFRDTDTGKFQPLPEVPGKEKEKVGREDSTSLYAELGLSSSDTETDEEMPSMAGPDPGKLDEGQAGPNPDDVAESQPLPTHSVLAGPNLEHSDVEITALSSQPQPEHMDEGFTAAAYPEVQENLKLKVDEQVIPEEPASSTGTLSSLQHLAKDFSFGDQFLNDKPSEAENEKSTTDTEAESMVSVTIQQDTSVIPPMMSPVIDSILIKRMGELKQHIGDLVEENQALEKRLDKQGDWINKLENVDLSKMIREQTVEFIDSQKIDRKINESVKEVVISSVKHTIRAPLRALQGSPYESIRHDECEDFDDDKAQGETKKKSNQDSLKPPPGSSPLPPPPPPPPSGISRALGTTGASDSAQAPPPLPPSSSTHQGGQSTSTAAPSSSKTVALAEYSAWTTTNTRIKPSITPIPDDLYMDDETTADEQAYSSGDEIGRDHIPTASALKATYAPPQENSLLAQTEDMETFMDWYYKRQGISHLTLQDLEGPAF